MASKLYVGGLAWATTDASLGAAFAPHGKVVSAKVVNDRETGRSRGFGFVEFASEEEATKAMGAMQDQEIDGRRIRIDLAREGQGGGGGGPRPSGPRPPRPAGGGYGGGGGGPGGGYGGPRRGPGGPGGGFGGGGGGGYGGGGGGGGFGGPPRRGGREPAPSEDLLGGNPRGLRKQRERGDRHNRNHDDDDE